MIKDIILNLETEKSRDSVCGYAISVAEAFDAHLAGVAFAGRGVVPSYFMPGVPPYVLDDVLRDSNQQAAAALERFEAAAKRSALSVECRLDTENGFSPAQSFSTMARRFDLSIIMQSDDTNGPANDLLIEAALFDSGRPMIVVPYIQKGGLEVERVVCCWDGSSAAARAINDSLDAALELRADDVEALLQSGSAPGTLSVTDNEIAAVQVFNRDGELVAASANARALPPMASALPTPGDRVESVSSLPFEDDPFRILVLLISMSVIRFPLSPDHSISAIPRGIDED